MSIFLFSLSDYINVFMMIIIVLLLLLFFYTVESKSSKITPYLTTVLISQAWMTLSDIGYPI